MAQEIGIRIYKRENSEKWRHQGCATSDRHGNRPHCSDEDHAHMAIVMTTPVMRTPHQVNKVALNDVWKRRVEKQMRRTKGASRSRDRGIRWAGGVSRRGRKNERH